MHLRASRGQLQPSVAVTRPSNSLYMVKKCSIAPHVRENVVQRVDLIVARVAIRHRDDFLILQLLVDQV